MAMTVRLPLDVAVEALARIDGITVSQVVCDAVAEYVDVRKAEPAFQARLRAHIAQLERLLV